METALKSLPIAPVIRLPRSRRLTPATVAARLDQAGRAMAAQLAIADTSLPTEEAEALNWIALLPPDMVREREVLLLRTVFDAATDRHRWSWRMMGRMWGCTHEACRKAHLRGVAAIVRALNRRALTEACT